MTYFPEIGHVVTILRGPHRNRQAVVKTIDGSTNSPIYVVENSPEILFADWVSPYDIERVHDVVNRNQIGLKPTNSVGAAAAVDAANIAAGAASTFTAPVDASRISFDPPVRQIIGRKIASAKTIDKFPVSAWRQAVADNLTYLGYTAWIDAIENGEDES